MHFRRSKWQPEPAEINVRRGDNDDSGIDREVEIDDGGNDTFMVFLWLQLIQSQEIYLQPRIIKYAQIQFSFYQFFFYFAIWRVSFCLIRSNYEKKSGAEIGKTTSRKGIWVQNLLDVQTMYANYRR